MGLAFVVLLGSGVGGADGAAMGKPPENVVRPAVSGSTLQGQTLAASTGSWSGAPKSYVYGWQDCDLRGAGCVSIRGANTPTLKLVARDVGHTVRVVVTASNGEGAMTARSGPSRVVRRVAISVSTSGDDSTCKRAGSSRPCATFGKAYRLARCGDTIGVDGGAYPAQTVLFDERKTCTDNPVVIQPVADPVSVNSPSCTPTPTDCVALFLGSTTTSVSGPSWLTIKGITVNGDLAVYGNGGMQGDHITLDHITGGGGVVSDATNFVLSNSSMGPCQAEDVSPHTTPCDSNFIFASQNGGYSTTARITHVTFHDFTKATVESHFECLFVLDVTTIVIQGSWFYNCMEAGIQLEYRETPASVVIQNTWFGRTSDNDGKNNECNAIRLSANEGTQTNTLIRYNSFAHGQGVILSSGAPTSGVRMIGNLFGVDPADYCGSQGRIGMNDAVYDFNVWEAHRWGDHSKAVSRISRLYVDGSDLGSANYHLSGAPGNTAADNLVSATEPDDSLATDRDGERRSAPRDAGADDRTRKR